jgi:hypothetical protein
MIQQENRLRSVPDNALREMLLRMGQTGQVGTPEYLLAAGEMQARKNVRQQAQMGQPQQPPVIADLLSGVDMQGMMPPQAQPQGQPQMPMAPEDAGGVAGLPAENMAMLGGDGYAGGGIVAFANGDEVRTPVGRWFSGQVDTLKRLWQEARTPTERQRIQRQMESIAVRPFEAVTDPEYQRRTAEVESLAGQLRALGAKPSSPADEEMPADVASGAFADKALAARGITYEQPSGAPAAVPGGKAPAGGGAGAPAGMFGTVDEFMKRYYPRSTETAPTPAEAIAQEREALEAAGVDLDPTKELREQITAEREDRKGAKEKLGWQALAQFGLTLSSTPGDFVSAIGKAGLPALKDYASEVKELKKLAREDERLISQLKVTDNQLKINFTTSALNRRDKILERIETERGRAGTIAANVAGGLMSLEGAKVGRGEQREDRLVIEAQRQAREMIKSTPQGMTMSPAELEREVSTLSRKIYEQMKALQTGQTVKDDLSGWGTPRVKKQ